jgi:hypothetical protein
MTIQITMIFYDDKSAMMQSNSTNFPVRANSDNTKLVDGEIVSRIHMNCEKLLSSKRMPCSKGTANIDLEKMTITFS